LIRSQEKISCYSHLVGVFAAIAGTVYLIYTVRSSVAHVVVSIVYGFSVILLFLASATYHALKQNENEISIWRKLDHIAIFFMIAGTYTPVCYVYLSGYWKWSIIIIQWALVIAGLFLKFFYLKAPRYFSTIIYLLMGWIGIMSIKELLTTMPPMPYFTFSPEGYLLLLGRYYMQSKNRFFDQGLVFTKSFTCSCSWEGYSITC